MKTTRFMGKLTVAAVLLASNVPASGEVGLRDSSALAEVRPPQEAHRPFRIKAHLDGISVAVSEDGRLLTSADRADWMEVPLAFGTFLRGLACGDGLFVVVGGSYVGRHSVILTSRDGTRWTRRQSGTRANLYGVAHGNGMFVTVGDNAAILTSRDGVAWRSYAPATSGVLLSSVVFGNGTFVAVGDSGTVLSSTDAIQWQPRNSGTPAYLSRVHYEAGAFVVAGDDGLLLISSNGIAWEPQGAVRQLQVGGMAETTKSIETAPAWK